MAPNPLSGLTADERRVHRLLVHALDRENTRSGFSSGLSYAEKKRIAESLDLAFIQREIDGMEAFRAQNEAGPTSSQAEWEWKARLFIALLVLAAPVALWDVLSASTPSGALIVVGIGAVFMVLVRSLGERERLAPPSTRQKIYEDLRELALALDLSDAAESPSIRRADLLIDSLTTEDRASAPRLRTRS